MPGEPIKDLVSRLRDRSGDDRPHVVVCGSDALVYTVAEELISADRPLRITVITPPDLRPDVPNFDDLKARGVRVITAARLDERTFREAGLAGAAGLALAMPDDMVNLHAALCARAVEGDLRLVIRMFTTGLAQNVRRLFTDCAVLSDAAMAAPAFVSAALGEVAPTHFRYAGRTLYVTRREDAADGSVVLPLTAPADGGQIVVLPGNDEGRPADLVLAEAVGRSSGPAAARRRPARSRRLSVRRALRVGMTRKLTVAVAIAVTLTVAAGAVLTRYTGVHGFWESIYLTMLTVVGSSDVEPDRRPIAQAAQLVLTVAGVALLPLITAAVVDGVVKTRLARERGEVFGEHADHVVLVGLGNVGTRILRQLNDFGVDVVGIDVAPDARGVRVAEELGRPVIVGDASQAETLRAASIDTCRALVVVSTDDAVNLQAALHARAARSDLRVVLRLFDDDFATRVQDVFDINISRSVPRLCAPAFAAALLEREVLATIPVGRHALLVATAEVAARSDLDGAPLGRVDRPQSARVIAMRSAGEQWVDWQPDPRRVLSPGDEVVVVARRAGLRALRQQAAAPLTG
ncbi:potassium channel family protein [Paractinoplanes toevensis]|uniref:Potassium transporter TrkA n=1 Tax=Paractinoplanes toevensis TaxID=571911 RepID=A0A919TET1_9ACTN|nr:NAD-binding protein [Actinoplanes toevensis]GIM93526.1 potassium transporter TrkA [Actinoplanes toevensis]